MSFITKLNLQGNRQHHLPTRENHILSGTTEFGVPFNTLTTGPDLSNSGTTGSMSNIISTFSGNTGETIFTFGDSRMDIAQGEFTPLTPSNSASTQSSGDLFTGGTPSTVDGHDSFLDYVGVSFDIEVMSIDEVSQDVFTGTVKSDEVYFLSAGTLDFTGRTIWSDVKGIHRTDEIIITKGAQNNYVLTSDSEGKGIWRPMSGWTTGGTGTDTFTTGATLDGNLLRFNRNDGSNMYNINLTPITTPPFTGNTSGNCINDIYVTNIHGCDDITVHSSIQHTGNTAIGKLSVAFGSGTEASGIGSHAEGYGTVASGDYSHAEGYGTIASGVGSHAEGDGTIASGVGSHAEGYITIASGASSHSEGHLTITIGKYSHAEGERTVAIGDNSHSGGMGNIYGYTVAGGIASFAHFTNDTTSIKGAMADNSAILGGMNHNISSGATGSVILGGDNISATTANTVYVPNLIIDGLTGGTLEVDIDGRVVAGASDMRLKKNIEPLFGGLEVIKNLRGVSYEWTDESNMGAGIRYGLIAQEVQEVIPNMVRSRSKGGGMLTLNYNEIVPWLIESIKEISSVEYKNTILETQTILSEDNSIELNYNGTNESAVGGGISVKNSSSIGVDSFIKVDENGKWIIGPSMSTSQLSLPEYSPTNTSDVVGDLGDVVWDDNYLYIKTNQGWRRSNLETF